MKKLLFAVLIIAVALTSVLVVTGISMRREVEFVPTEAISTDNPANYVESYDYSCQRAVDYSGDNFAYLQRGIFSSKLIVINTSGSRTELNGVTAPFKLRGDKVFYIKYGTLYCRDIYTGGEAVVAVNTEDFALGEDCIVYLTRRNGFIREYLWFTINYNFRLGWLSERLESALKEDDGLYLLSFETLERKQINRGQGKFFIKNDKLYLYNTDNDSMVREISLDDLSEKELFSEHLRCLMPYREGFLYSFGEHMYIIYPENEGKLSYEMLEDGPNNNVMICICSDTKIFFSFEKWSIDRFDGLFPYRADEDKKHDINGVWEFDPETGEKEKLTSETFDRLYLFGEDQLFGQQGVDVYKIDINTGRVDRITE